LQDFKFEARHGGDGVLLYYVRFWEELAADEEKYRIHVFILQRR
jgi:predicted secreted protein